MSLPFELSKNHKYTSKYIWKKSGLVMTNFEEIYNRYIVATNCELCNKEFPNTRDRCMDHNHETGEFRNIVCNRCNILKDDRFNKNNTSGYKGISKEIDNHCNQGFIWVFRASVDGKRKKIKTSIDYNKLVAFADKWKLDNNYHT
jgi:hypothetical protein